MQQTRFVLQIRKRGNRKYIGSFKKRDLWTKQRRIRKLNECRNRSDVSDFCSNAGAGPENNFGEWEYLGR